jgi:hypothetical protein
LDFKPVLEELKMNQVLWGLLRKLLVGIDTVNTSGEDLWKIKLKVACLLLLLVPLVTFMSIALLSEIIIYSFAKAVAVMSSYLGKHF